MGGAAQLIVLSLGRRAQRQGAQGSCHPAEEANGFIPGDETGRTRVPSWQSHPDSWPA